MSENRCQIKKILYEPHKNVNNRNYFQKRLYHIGDEQFRIKLNFRSGVSPPGGVTLEKWSDQNGWLYIHDIKVSDDNYLRDVKENYFTPYFTKLQKVSKKFATACMPL